MTTRKKYTKEFKLDAVSLITEQDYSRAEAARSLGINAKKLDQVTTPALYRSSLGLFKAAPCRAALEGLPPSQLELRHLQ